MQWISVKDKLPKDYQTVLAYGKVQHHNKGKFKEIVQCWYKNDCFEINADIDGISTHCDSNDVLDVTHWIPLPNLPDEENEISCCKIIMKYDAENNPYSLDYGCEDHGWYYGIFTSIEKKD